MSSLKFALKQKTSFSYYRAGMAAQVVMHRAFTKLYRGSLEVEEGLLL
jgi:hypothetical protein